MPNTEGWKMFFNAQHAENILRGHGLPVESRTMWSLAAEDLRQKIHTVFQGRVSPEIVPSDQQGIKGVVFSLEDIRLLLEPQIVDNQKHITSGNVQTFLNIQQQLFQFTLDDENRISEEEIGTVEMNLQILLEIFPIIMELKDDIEAGRAQDLELVKWSDYNFARFYESLVDINNLPRVIKLVDGTLGSDKWQRAFAQYLTIS